MTPVRVIVDEGIGPNTVAWDQFQRVLGQRPAEYLFLAEAYPGIPDVEILDKLLGPETVLLTRDRVLHTYALARGFRSYTLNEHGQLTRRPLRGVRPPEPARSVHSELQDDYLMRPTLSGRVFPLCLRRTGAAQSCPASSQAVAWGGVAGSWIGVEGRGLRLTQSGTSSLTETGAQQLPLSTGE